MEECSLVLVQYIEPKALGYKFSDTYEVTFVAKLCYLIV